MLQHHVLGFMPPAPLTPLQRGDGGSHFWSPGGHRKVPSVAHDVTCTCSRESIEHIFDDIDLHMVKVTLKVTPEC